MNLHDLYGHQALNLACLPACDPVVALVWYCNLLKNSHLRRISAHADIVLMYWSHGQ
ncbi:MAG TPA: hypothetical protein VH592_17770 [Gemmataceae bacterium]